MKRATGLFPISILLVLLFTISGAASEGYEILPLQPFEDDVSAAVPGPTNRTLVENGESGTVFVMRRWVDASDYYLGSGAAGDTFATFLQPIAPCSVIYFQHEMYTAGNGTAFLWAPNPEWQAAFPNGRAVSRTEQYLSPIGDVIAGPTPITVPGQGWMDFMAEGELNVFLGDTASATTPDGQAPFNGGILAGWVKGGDTPKPLADNVSARGFTYTWFGGPWTADTLGVIQWGWYNEIIENMVEVGVRYTCPHIIVIQDLTRYSNTISPNRTYTVQGKFYDVDGWQQSSEQAYLVYEIHDVDEANDTTYVTIDSLMMQQVEVGSEIMQATIDLTDANLERGDQIHYWVNTYYLDWPNNTTRGNPVIIDVVELKAPNARVLWIDNGQFDFTEFNLYQRGLINNDDPEDDVVEVWDAVSNNGFDASLINAHAWDLILYTAYGDGGEYYMPFKDAVAGGPFDTYLNSTSGGLVFINPDYFYGNSNEEVVTFSAGEFAYDVFGISTGYSDPDPDSLFLGDSSDVISEVFKDSPFVLSYTRDVNNRRLNWADYFEITDASSVWFYGYNDGNTYGSVTPTTGGGNAYYLAINPTLATFNGDSANPYGNVQYWQLYTAILNEFGVATSAPETDQAQPTAYSLAPAYPNPFNPSTTVSYTVPQAGPVTLEVFDIMGRSVAVLKDGVVSAGTHSVSFDGSGLASGTYLVRLRGNGYESARKIVLLK